MSSSSTPKYKRVVLKISGEALRQHGSDDTVSPKIVQQIAQEIGNVRKMGVQVAVVVGGGNIWRGLAASHRGMNRATADYMGMLATVINGMALMSALEDLGFSTRVQTALHINHVAEPFILRIWKMVISLSSSQEPAIRFFPPTPLQRYELMKLGLKLFLKPRRLMGSTMPIRSKIRQQKNLITLLFQKRLTAACK